MVEVTQYSFSWPEVTEALLKKQGIHEGEWTAILEFAINAGVVGQGPADAKPGMMVVANGVQLLKSAAQFSASPHSRRCEGQSASVNGQRGEAAAGPAPWGLGLLRTKIFLIALGLLRDIDAQRAQRVIGSRQRSERPYVLEKRSGQPIGRGLGRLI